MLTPSAVDQNSGPRRHGVSCPHQQLHNLPDGETKIFLILFSRMLTHPAHADTLELHDGVLVGHGVE